MISFRLNHNEIVFTVIIDMHKPFAVGLSNFNSKQIDEIWEIARIKPTVLQNESHPYLIQKELIDYLKKYNIVRK